MPTKRKESERTLTEIFSELSPRLMSNGQIRMQCPFRENHEDGSGMMSFFATPSINAYHCFSCGAKGSLIPLLTRRFDVNYFEAVGMVRLGDYTKKSEEFELDISWSINKLPKEFLKKGFSKETLKHFRVGLTDDGDILIPYYKDFNSPITLLGYQRRWYYPERGVRNSRGFNKKEYLYNLDTSYSYVVVVEGQSDVWRLYQHGYNACALMGADISPWQVEQLAQFERVYLALDNDLAGRRATEIVYELLRNHTEIRLVPYTTKDPGDCIEKSEWESAFSNYSDYLEYSLTMTTEWDEYLDMKEEVLREVRARKTDLDY